MSSITLLSNEDLDVVSGGRIGRNAGRGGDGGAANGGVFADRGGEVDNEDGDIQANSGGGGGGGGGGPVTDNSED